MTTEYLTPYGGLPQNKNMAEDNIDSAANGNNNQGNGGLSSKAEDDILNAVQAAMEKIDKEIEKNKDLVEDEELKKSESISPEKIKHYADRIEAGEDRDKVLAKVPQKFRNDITEELAKRRVSGQDTQRLQNARRDMALENETIESEENKKKIEHLVKVLKRHGVGDEVIKKVADDFLDPEWVEAREKQVREMDLSTNDQIANLYALVISEWTNGPAFENVKSALVDLWDENDREQENQPWVNTTDEGGEQAQNLQYKTPEEQRAEEERLRAMGMVPAREGTGGGGRRPPNRPVAEGGAEGDDENSPLTPAEQAALNAMRNAQSRAETPEGVLRREISYITNPKQFRDYANEEIRHRVNAWPDDMYDATHTYKQKLDELFNNVNGDNLESSKADLLRLGTQIIEEHRGERGRSEREAVPKSLEEFVALIMARSREEYQPGGIKELMDSDGKINFANFASWIRQRAIFWTNFSPDNPNVDIFSSIKLSMEYRTITMGEALFEGDDQYFRKRVLRGVDEYGHDVYDYVHDDEYSKFRGQMLNEIFYYQMTRGWNIYNLQQKEDMDELNKTLGQIFTTSVFTRGDGFKALFSLPGISEGNMLDAKNGRVGELVALAEKVYQQNYNLEELQKLLGKNATLFKENFAEADDDGNLQWEQKPDGTYELKTEERDHMRKGATTVGGVRIMWDKDWYDENGILKARTIPDNATNKEKLEILEKDWVRGQFLDYINIFNEQNKDIKIINEFRERLRQSLMDRTLETLKLPNGEFDPNKPLYQKLKSNFDKKVREGTMSQTQADVDIKRYMMQFAYEDARLAEEIGFTFGWMGIRGMNDTTSTGWDASTKLYHTERYRSGQSSPNRIGADIGNPRTIGIDKAMVVPFYGAVKSMDGEVLQEKIDKIAHNFVRNVEESPADRVEGVDLAKNMRFRFDSMKTYYGNHFARGVTEYKSYAGASEWNLDKIVTWDPFKGVVVDRASLYKMFDSEFVKPGRYRVSGWGDTDFTRDFENFKIERNKENDSVVHTVKEGEKTRSFRVINPFKEKLGSFMFGKQVFEREYMDEETGEVDYEKATGSGRGVFWKEPVILRMAAEIKAHRDMHDIGGYWDNHKVRMFFHALEKLPANVEVDEENNMKTHARSHAFTEEELAYIKKLAGVQDWKMNAVDIGGAFFGGGLSGLINALKKIFAETTEVITK